MSPNLSEIHRTTKNGYVEARGEPILALKKVMTIILKTRVKAIQGLQ